METAASVTMLELKRRNVLVTVANLLKDSEKNKNLSIIDGVVCLFCEVKMVMCSGYTYVEFIYSGNYWYFGTMLYPGSQEKHK
ncbi:hypothetical protein YC2023_110412 [Brassica napus]